MVSSELRLGLADSFLHPVQACIEESSLFSIYDEVWKTQEN